LWEANLLLFEQWPAAAYDFAITMGLIGDYVPYYIGLPSAVRLLHPGGILGFAVETRSTPWRSLEKLAADLGLDILSETELTVENGKLVSQRYQFYVGRGK
jgi:hypothetical protein